MTGVALTGVGRAEAGCDPRPQLRVRKMRKYMAGQDALAVVAAGAALADAGLGRLDDPLGERAGLYLAVGVLPFEQSDIDRLLDGSLDDDGRFSTARFATGGYEAVNPLITFRCLSNMPAFHISMNFNIQGPYLTTYPGAGQLYQALEEARWALEDGRVDLALVGGVAHQENFLVRHHMSRVRPPTPADALRDAAGVLVLEREADAVARGAPVRARLTALELSYHAADPFEQERGLREAFAGGVTPPGQLGTASLPVGLRLSLDADGSTELVHTVEARDGITGRSRWELVR